MITCAFRPSDPTSSAHLTAQFELPHDPKSGTVASKIPTNVTGSIPEKKISEVLICFVLLSGSSLFF